MGNYQQVIADFSQAIKSNPELADAYNNRGNIRSLLGDYWGAIIDYNRALGIEPNLPDAYNNRGNAYSYFGNYREAISNYNQALKLNPELFFTYHNRGAAYLELGDYEAALGDINRAIELQPNFANAYERRSIYFIKSSIILLITSGSILIKISSSVTRVQYFFPRLTKLSCICINLPSFDLKLDKISRIFFIDKFPISCHMKT
ncbi:MAG: tetratricopeptide repeat protein [Okeania sp. SIO2C2]|uniref:tetratricopeptide repeat protein n=1 Tax=Okeania sp. SIO2C2 TaxID=2607787 RepID=UPI0013BACFB0|nr:tetratricopeptide repeat protein [Okeania sp. SIO2C2]NEP86174.1 tetratricopeptide repeat protein [Okeania sp. SIO2C2]